MASASQHYTCYSSHASSSGCPLDILPLVHPQPGSNRSFLEKLKRDDKSHQEILREWHAYAFNMGNDKLFVDYHKAADALLERNLPTIFHDQQQGAAFIPETDLPKVARAVNISLQNRDIDLEVYEKRKRDLDLQSKDYLQIKGGTEEKQNIQGDLVELDLSEALKVEMKDPNIQVLVLQGPSFKTPDSANNDLEEHDFVVVHKKLKYILGIESKRTLTNKTFHKAMEQLNNLRTLLNTYFGDELQSGEWVFMGMVHYDHIYPNKTSLCPSCQRFALHSASQLPAKLAQAEALLKTSRPACTPCHEEYKTVVKNLMFTVLAQPMASRSLVTNEVYNKIVGKKAKKMGKNDIPGQGDVRTILFWTVDQANLMLSHHPKFQFVTFISSWSTGKTLCMREMARRRAMQFPGKQVFFCIMQNCRSKKSLLVLELENIFSDLPNVTVKLIETDGPSSDGLQKLEQEIKSQPGSSWFTDEFILPDPSEHAAFTSKLQQLVQYISNQPGQPLLWMAMAGIYHGESEHFEVFYLKAVLSPLHVVEGMDSPLRNSLATLRAANLETGTSPNPLDVSGDLSSNIRWTVPPRLIPGVEGLTFSVQNINDRGEVEAAVKRAREAMADRLGPGGVPVLCNMASNQLKWIKSGLDQARRGSSQSGGWRNWMQRVLSRLSGARWGSQTLVYGGLCGGQSEASEDQVAKWLEALDKGQVEEDLLTDEDMSRGWESQAVLVVGLIGGSGLWQNLVIRSMATSVIVKEA